jgi:filamentous hemagglutinin
LKTFDNFVTETALAVSTKTMDTITATKIAKPKQIYYELKRHIDAAVDFTEAELSGYSLHRDQIKSREIQLGIPAQTTPAQRVQINRAIEYGDKVGVKVVVTQIRN